MILCAGRWAYKRAFGVFEPVIIIFLVLEGGEEKARRSLLGYDKTTSLTSLSRCNNCGAKTTHQCHYTMALAE